MEFIPWMIASHLLHPIKRRRRRDGRDESLAQPDTISPSHNSTFPLSLFQSCQASSWEQREEKKNENESQREMLKEKNPPLCM
ncbi:hypothetical protein E2320_003636 [Naja naja]|nr:hypothetical protein E2320_003636 [Naja naja]